LRSVGHSHIDNDTQIFAKPNRTELCHQVLLLFRRIQSQKANRLAFAGADHGKYIEVGHRSESGATRAQRRFQAAGRLLFCVRTLAYRPARTEAENRDCAGHHPADFGIAERETKCGSRNLAKSTAGWFRTEGMSNNTMRAADRPLPANSAMEIQ